MSEGKFEALKVAMRQTKDGVVISFVVQPEDFESALAMVPIGARVMVAWAEIDTDETKKGGEAHTVPDPNTGHDKTQPQAEPVALSGARPKRPFSSLSLPEQAGIRCSDAAFCEFMVDTRGILNEDVPAHVRGYCGVNSRAELATNESAAKDWRNLNAEFEAWQTTQKYAAIRR